MLNNQYFSNLKSFENYFNNITSSFFNIISINIRSISSITKFNKFKNLIAMLPRLPCIIAVQESWIEKKQIQLYNIAGYRSVHCCRDDGYGGTSLFIRENLDFDIESCESRNFVDSVVLTLNNVKFNGRPIKFMSFYRSQKCDIQSFLSFLENLLIIYGRHPCVFVGDSNIDGSSNICSGELLNLLGYYDFENCHTLITRPDSRTSIDHVYSNINNALRIDSVECKLSDHNIISCKIEIEHSSSEFTDNIKLLCDYNRAKNLIQSQLPSLSQSGDPSLDTTALISCIGNAIENSTVTKQTKRIIKQEITPWINVNLQKLIIYKKKLLKLRRKKKSNIDIDMRLKRISNVIKNACKESMNNYYMNNLSNIQHDPKKCWKFLNETLGRTTKRSLNLKDSNGETILHDLQKAEFLNRHFLQSIAHLRVQIQHTSTDSFNFFRTMTLHNDRLTFEGTTYEEVKSIISNLSPCKSSGHDNISTKLLLECSNELTPYISNLFNTIISSSIYPDVLKIHKVVPIPKEKNASTADKFRPIAVLSIIDNIFERILYNQISIYMKNHNLLNDFQYGFREGCGTEEAVVNVVNFICKGLDEGSSGVAGIFYDFSKAFDLIDHDILIQKLEYYGVRGNELSLLKSYLSSRKQFVQINNHRSSFGDVECGVPQGSVLGPLLFTIYLNDIKNLGLSGKIFIYADDICIFYPYKHETAVKAYMERDASLLSEFARINKLILNASKTQLIRFKPYNLHNINFSVFVDGSEVTEVHTVKYLGIHLQSNLAWSDHIQYIKGKTAQAVGILYKFKNKFDRNTKFLLYNALIQSHFNYLAILYGYKKSTEFKSLQRIQNKALKLVSNLPVRHPTISLYRDIFQTVLPIYGTYKMQLLLYVFKCVHNIGHHTILFRTNQYSISTRTNGSLTLAWCRLETTKQRIEYMGSREFNNLPPNIKNVNRISVFKTMLKNHLLQHIEELV